MLSLPPSLRRAFAACCALLCVGAHHASAVIYEGAFTVTNRPTGFAVSPKTGDIFMTVNSTGYIYEYPAGGSDKYKNSWGAYGSVKTVIRGPTFLTFGPDGNLYIYSGYDGAIWKGTPAGKNLSVFYTRQFQKPTAMAVDANNEVYVTDQKTGTVTKLSSKGDQLHQWVVPKPGEPNTPARGLEDIYADIRTSGGVKTTYLYVVDGADGVVRKYTTQGALLKTFGSKGTGRGQLMHPVSVTVDDLGLVYVADPSNERIQIYEPDGSPGYDFVITQGHFPTFFVPLKLVLYKRTGTLYVLMSVNWTTVYKFRLY